MITVAGEALIDVVVGASGSLTALPGGAPFNVARTTALLGAECQFLGRLSDDGFGEQLHRTLARDGVRLAVPQPTHAPTTLAVAQIDAVGSAHYRFYLEGTSAAQLRAGDLEADVLAGSTALAFGGLGLVLEPTGSTLATVVEGRPADLFTLLDPNCRPEAIGDMPTYRRTLARFTRRADVVKVSVEDLTLLRPDVGTVAAARSLLELGPAAVLITDGPDPVRILAAGGEASVPVPVVEIIDTIGAGDAFVGGLLTWWTRQSLTRANAADLDALTAATTAAVQVAAADCTVRGAGLPAGFSWPDGGQPWRAARIAGGATPARPPRSRPASADRSGR